MTRTIAGTVFASIFQIHNNRMYLTIDNIYYLGEVHKLLDFMNLEPNNSRSEALQELEISEEALQKFTDFIKKTVIKISSDLKAKKYKNPEKIKLAERLFRAAIDNNIIICEETDFLDKDELYLCTTNQLIEDNEDEVEEEVIGNIIEEILHLTGFEIPSEEELKEYTRNETCYMNIYNYKPVNFDIVVPLIKSSTTPKPDGKSKKLTGDSIEGDLVKVENGSKKARELIHYRPKDLCAC